MNSGNVSPRFFSDQSASLGLEAADNAPAEVEVIAKEIINDIVVYLDAIDSNEKEATASLLWRELAGQKAQGELDACIYDELDLLWESNESLKALTVKVKALLAKNALPLSNPFSPLIASMDHLLRACPDYFAQQQENSVTQAAS